MTRKLTACVHAGTTPDPLGGATSPIQTATAYAYVPGREIAYPRYSNIPIQQGPAAKIAALEGAEAGLVFASGIAAISCALTANLAPGDHAVVHRSIYGGTFRLVTQELTRLGVEITLVDGLATSDVAEALRPGTRLLHLESPTNPLLRILDLRAVAELCRARGVLSVIDNTFATPINQNPLALGFDLVVHSGTKYLSGHNDLCCGAAVGRAELIAPIYDQMLCRGPSLNVYDAYLLERGMKTLGLRVARQNENAQILAEYLAAHPKVRAVHYPGLPSHPGHGVAASQMSGFGGMLAFEYDGPQAQAMAAVGRLQTVRHALSLGGVESLICFPALTSHEMMTPAQRAACGVTDSLLRLSVGIEDPADLLEDMERALA